MFLQCKSEHATPHLRPPFRVSLGSQPLSKVFSLAWEGLLFLLQPPHCQAHSSQSPRSRTGCFLFFEHSATPIPQSWAPANTPSEETCQSSKLGRAAPALCPPSTDILSMLACHTLELPGLPGSSSLGQSCSSLALYCLRRNVLGSLYQQILLTSLLNELGEPGRGLLTHYPNLEEGQYGTRKD